MVVSTSPSHDSRLLRVFISSTFVDFMEERDLLVKQVFPSLRRRAASRGVEIVDVDLRWGVTEEQTRRGETLPLCLAEIDRCRPYFIGLLGERYGWVPPADHTYYKLELLERQPWLQERMGGVSVTELEFLYGVLHNPEIASYARFYLRDPAYAYSRQNNAWLAQSEEERQRLRALKDKVRACGFPVVEGLSDPEAIAKRIEEDLWALIEERFPEVDHLDALGYENKRHTNYFQSRMAGGFVVGIDDYVSQVRDLLDRGEQQILIAGEKGAGKSTLIAQWMASHQQSQPRDIIYFHHVNRIDDFRVILSRLVKNAKNLLGIKEELSLKKELVLKGFCDSQERMDRLEKEEVFLILKLLSVYCLARNCHWILVLDGLDRLPVEHQGKLPWLPWVLPKGIHVIVTTLSCPAKAILTDRGYKVIHVNPLSQANKGHLIRRYLSKYSKSLEAEILSKIENHPLASLPGCLTVLLEELRICGHYDNLLGLLNHYLSSGAIEDLYVKILHRLESDGHETASRRALTALWASRIGLLETDLLEAAGLARLEISPVTVALERELVSNGILMAIDHGPLRKAIEKRYLQADNAKTRAYSDLADYFLAKNSWDQRIAEELPWLLAKAHRFRDLAKLLIDKKGIVALVDYGRSGGEIAGYLMMAKCSEKATERIIREIVTKRLGNGPINKDGVIFVERLLELIDEVNSLQGEKWWRVFQLKFELIMLSVGFVSDNLVN